jgi:hypothetical protein
LFVPARCHPSQKETISHTIDWDHSKVLESCQQWSQRLKSLYIYKQPAPLNQEHGPLPPGTGRTMIIVQSIHKFSICQLW